MSELVDRQFRLVRHLAAVLATLLVLGGCFEIPSDDPVPRPAPSEELAAKVRLALRDKPEDAITYAGLYASLAARFEAGAYSTTSEAASVSGGAADILGVPGVLKQIVNDELNPLLGTPEPLTPQLRTRASEKLQALSIACREAAQ